MLSAGRYNVVISPPIDVSGENRYARNYINDGEDFFIGSIYGFDNRISLIPKLTDITLRLTHISVFLLMVIIKVIAGYAV